MIITVLDQIEIIMKGKNIKSINKEENTVMNIQMNIKEIKDITMIMMIIRIIIEKRIIIKIKGAKRREIIREEKVIEMLIINRIILIVQMSFVINMKEKVKEITKIRLKILILIQIKETIIIKNVEYNKNMNNHNKTKTQVSYQN